ncbi:hypothetical protein XMIN_1687 [Xanthomonas citri pv. mangiferaeindicae LMG 941]|nr:hypothetical protein XMIN_1687 [Xanthomonas citri pv. mangiferaeindicae LMG 941]
MLNTGHTWSIEVCLDNLRPRTHSSQISMPMTSAFKEIVMTRLFHALRRWIQTIVGRKLGYIYTY